MLRIRRIRTLSILMILLWLHAVLPSLGGAQSVAAGDSSVRLQEVRELIKTGEYGRAIEQLRTLRDELRASVAASEPAASAEDVAAMRETYLLLVKTHEYLGIDAEAGRQGIAAAEPYYVSARELIEECLRVPELRHTRPDPPSEYPDRMLEDFERVRGEIFGAFRITSLEPADAAVVLDGDVLQAAPGDSLIQAMDLLVETPHVLVVQRPGYRDLTEELRIEKGTVLAKPYRLSKKRSKTWYAVVGTGLVVVVGGAAALIAGSSDGGQTSAEPLPGPPGPPSN